MAIVGLLILGLPERMAELRAALEREPGVVDVQPTEEATRLAVVLETGAEGVESVITRMLEWECVVAVDVAYVSYEDELEAGGIACPPHKTRTKGA